MKTKNTIMKSANAIANWVYTRIKSIFSKKIKVATKAVINKQVNPADYANFALSVGADPSYGADTTLIYHAYCPFFGDLGWFEFTNYEDAYETAIYLYEVENDGWVKDGGGPVSLSFPYLIDEYGYGYRGTFMRTDIPFHTYP